VKNSNNSNNQEFCITSKYFRNVGFALLKPLVLPVLDKKRVKARKNISDYRYNNDLGLDEDPQSFISKSRGPDLAGANLLKKHRCWLHRWLLWNS